MSDTIPIVMTPAGLQPQQPVDIYAQILAGAAALSPGYTARLPGSLIEDVGSTDTAAAIQCDQAVVELVNSMTPYGANLFILQQLGQVYLGQGSELAGPTNTSAFVVFTTSPSTPGTVIPQGFLVSDGTHQYVIPDGGITGSDGTTPPLFALATLPGSWSVPANTITQIATSAPTTTASLTVTNPEAGTPGGAAQTAAQYRSQVLRAGLAASQGMSRYLRTLLSKVSGVQARLVKPLQQAGGGWSIICGGGDPYQVAYAIYQSLFDISTLVGSTLAVLGITNANPGVVTTNLNHGYSTGQVINIAGVVGMSGVNNTPLTITVITEKTFSIGLDTTSSGSWTSGGVVTPNFRNISVSISDYPDTYVVPYVNPPQQIVTMAVTWGTDSPNLVSPAAVAQLGAPALAAYVNSITVGDPLNLFQLQEVFTALISSVLPAPYLTRMVFAVSINSVGTSPSPGTGIIAGDQESYFYAVPSGIVISQG